MEKGGGEEGRKKQYKLERRRRKEYSEGERPGGQRNEGKGKKMDSDFRQTFQKQKSTQRPKLPL